MLTSIVIPAYAESAPVYDAEDMSQPPLDAQFAQNQADLFPPPPQSSQEGTFVPMQQQGPIDPANPDAAAPAAPSPIPLSMDQRMQRVEQQINNMQNNESSGRIDSLQDQVQSLRGQVEQLSHQLEIIRNEQQGLISDLDKRFAQLQQNANSNKSTTLATTAAPLAPAAAPIPTAPATDVNNNVPATVFKSTRKAAAAGRQLARTSSTNSIDVPKSPDNQPNVAEEQQIYQTAYNLIKSKKYNDAINVLQNMLQKYPSGQFASNAHYWLGELYGLLGKNDQALIEFGTVVKNYPDSPRISDAQLKVGLIYAAQFKWGDAKNAFKKVINHYPGTTSARLASEQLKQIKQAGH